MTTINRNRHTPFLASVLLLCSLPLQAADNSMPLNEEAPPWAARENLRPLNPALPVAAPAPARAATTSRPTAGGSMESWYRNRKNQLQSVSSVTDLQARAAQGDKNAQYELGLFYQAGRSGAPDFAKAQEWLLTAANAGHDKAQYALALLLRSGGETASLAQSLKWQETAARAGNAEAQYGLGLLYANGQYVAPDATVARFWFAEAAKRGHQAANLVLTQTPAAPRVTPPVAKPVERVAPQQVATRRPPPPAPAPVAAEPAPEQTGFEYVEPATAAADVAVEHNDSQVDLGNMTVEQVMAAARQGDMYAQLMLGALYEDGSDGVEQNYSEAAQWYLKSARQGYPKAQYNLALLYEDGRGVEQNYQQAAVWYQKSAQAGFSEAQNNLAVMYIMGNGVPEDKRKAEQLLTQAVQMGNENARRNLQMLQEQEGTG